MKTFFSIILVVVVTFTSFGQQSLGQRPTIVKEYSAREIASNFLPSVALLVCDDGREGAQGSGFFIKPGILITNYHVIKGMSRGFAYIKLKANQERKKLRILSVITYDEKSDLALLNVPEAESLEIPSLLLADNQVINEIGATIYALGNPEGLMGTISPGIISAQLRASEKNARLQITAPISHGSSGGPVVNTYGRVIGVAVGSLSEGQNLNFAVPVTLIRSLLSTAKLPDELDDYILSSTSVALKDGWIWQHPEQTLLSKEAPIPSVIGPKREGESDEVASLRKLEGVYVVVEDLDDDAKYLFTSSQIQLEVESKLRRNGVRVLSKDEWLRSPGNPYLYLKINILRNQTTGVFTYSFSLSLSQDAKLVRDPTFSTLLPTWTRDTVGYAGSQVASSAIRSAIGEYIDRFCIDFLKANK